MTEKENRTGIIVLAILGVLAAVGGVYSIVSAVRSSTIEYFSIYSTKNLKNTSFISKIAKIPSDYIAILQVDGVIEDKNETYNQLWLLETIETLRFDSKNKAILLNVNSPGGGIFEADEVYLALEDYKSEGKPVWAYMEQMAASGGYYITCAADVIYANRNTLTGSIGVFMGPVVDISELLQKYGIKTRSFTSGKNKNMLSFDTPITPEQAQIMQSIVDEAYEQFVSVVAQARKLSLDEVRKLADGRIYTAKQAKESGLVDEIGRFEAAVSALQFKVAGENSEYALEYFEPKQRQSLYNMFRNMDYWFEGRGQGISLKLLEDIEKLFKQARNPRYQLQ